jgi:diacylglycerol kinase (ATP)
VETKEYLLIYNFKSGKGKIRKDITKIKAFFELNNRRLGLFESKEKKDILKLINSHYSKYTNWIVAGGDGTVSSVVNVVMQINGNRPVISVLPYGSANDIAYILGMKKKLSFNLKTIFQ